MRNALVLSGTCFVHLPALVRVTQNAFLVLECASGVGGCARLSVCVCVCWLWFASARACVRRLKVLQGLVQTQRRRLEATKTLKYNTKTLKSLFLSN